MISTCDEDEVFLKIEELKRSNESIKNSLYNAKKLNAFLRGENKELSGYVSKLSITGDDFMEIYHNIEERLEHAIEIGEHFLKVE